MNNPTRIKVAAATTAIALGGLAAAGIALKGDEEAPVATTASAHKARPVVIHRTRVRRLPAKRPAPSSPPAASSMAATPAPAAAPIPATVVAPAAQPAVSVPAPKPVSSRASPAGSGGGDDAGYEDGEAESGD